MMARKVIFNFSLLASVFSSFFFYFPLGFVSGFVLSPGSGRSKIKRKTPPSKNYHFTSSVALAASTDGIDPAVIQGVAIAVAGLVAGIGLVAFTEGQGERSKQRGSGLSESMSTRIAGKLIEDVEIKSDLSSLTGQLEKALMETGAAKEEDLALSEEKKKKIKEQTDEGW